MPPQNPSDSSLWKRVRQDRWWLLAVVLTGLFSLAAVACIVWAVTAYAGSARPRPDVMMNMPEEAVRVSVSRLTAAELPAGAWDLHGQFAVYGSAVLHVRFTTNERDFYNYLKASPALPDALVPSERAVTTEIGPPVGWWRPDDLLSISGCECDWPAGADNVACRMVAGRRGDKMIVYMQFTIDRAR